MKVNFNKITLCGRELEYIKEAISIGRLEGGGKFMKMCEAIIAETASSESALLTTSCTSATDIAAILCDLKDGDEFIVPTYTFVSTVNSFVLRGAKPVFCDIRPDTLNIDETKIESLITPRTKLIVPVHYAGVSCQMDAITAIAKRYGLKVVEDAAQGFCSYYKGKHLGTLGDIGALSFHGTKNVVGGEAGALLVKDPMLCERANFIREKGTNRIRFIRGEIDKYTWVDYGSSFIPGELISAFLAAQLENSKSLTDSRIKAWEYYDKRLEPLEREGFFKRGKIPPDCKGNAHIFFIICKSPSEAQSLRDCAKSQDIAMLSHYAPLHSCPMAKRLGCPDTRLPVAEFAAASMLRLPIYSSITPGEQDAVCKVIEDFFAR